MEVKSHTCEVKTEADNNDTIKHTRDDKPRPYLKHKHKHKHKHNI